jgi:hypothetical protein
MIFLIDNIYDDEGPHPLGSIREVLEYIRDEVGIIPPVEDPRFVPILRDHPYQYNFQIEAMAQGGSGRIGVPLSAILEALQSSHAEIEFQADLDRRLSNLAG